MSVRHPLFALALAGLLVAPAGLSGCDRRPTTVVEQNGGSEEQSGTLTPLERGRYRREALGAVRAGIAAWQASDAEEMKRYWDDGLVSRFETAWAEYREEGLRVEHVQETEYLDVVEMDANGTQAVVKYRFRDESYLVDASGEKVRSLDPADVEMQMTMENEDGRWRIVRSIAGDRAYR